MLSANTRLPDAMLKELIRRHCSDLGKVEEVCILRQTAPSRVEIYALVTMATTGSALAVRRTFGDMMYGDTSVYIGLLPGRIQ
jgi:hypothetical protein